MHHRQGSGGTEIFDMGSKFFFLAYWNPYSLPNMVCLSHMTLFFEEILSIKTRDMVMLGNAIQHPVILPRASNTGARICWEPAEVMSWHNKGYIIRNLLCDSFKFVEKLNSLWTEMFCTVVGLVKEGYFASCLFWVGGSWLVICRPGSAWKPWLRSVEFGAWAVSDGCGWLRPGSGSGCSFRPIFNEKGKKLYQYHLEVYYNSSASRESS